MVWLTGGALVVALLMIAGLLLFILVQGAATFWPGEVVQLTLSDGTQYLGELSGNELFRPAPASREQVESFGEKPSETWVRLETEDRVFVGDYRKELWYAIDDEGDQATAVDPLPEVFRRANEELTRGDGYLRRQQIRVGNFEYTGEHFAWVPDFEVQQTTTPQWAMVVERTSNGRFYGIPTALLIDGEPTIETDGPDAAARDAARRSIWQQFQEHHQQVRTRVDSAKERQRREIGRQRDLADRARLEVQAIQLELRDTKRALFAARANDAASSAHVEELQHAVKAKADELEAAKRRYESFLEQSSEQIAELRQDIEQLNAENDRYEIALMTAQGDTAVLPLATVVRMYPANHLSTLGKLGVYFDRWGEFFFSDPREANTEGGVWPAIVGTVMMTLIMVIAVVPFGVLAALYLHEYAKPGPLVSAVRVAINNLAGVPSVVFGVFGLGFFCYIVGGWIDGGPDMAFEGFRMPTAVWNILAGATILMVIAALMLLSMSMRTNNRNDWKARWTRYAARTVTTAAVLIFVATLATSPYFEGFFHARSAFGEPVFGKGALIWASLTLALLTLPVVIVASEEALAAVPNSMREGSYACGASKWQTIRRIVLPHSTPGIMTGLILAMARGAGEVAPLMLVGAVHVAPSLPLDASFPYLHPDRSFMHLGYHIYHVGLKSPNSEAAKPMVFTTTLLLIAIVAALNLSAIWLRARLRRRFRTTQF